jgi:hypothetical protein
MIGRVSSLLVLRVYHFSHKTPLGYLGGSFPGICPM